MLNLIKKDFVAGAIFLPGIALIVPFITTIATWAMIKDFGGLIVGIFTFIIIALCVGASFIFITIDTSFGTEMTYASLPVKRSTIVMARYVSSIIITISSFTLVVLSCLSSIYIFNRTDPAFDLLLSLRGISSMISLLFVILTIILPFMFKFGPGKGIIAALIAQICVVLIGPTLEFLQDALNDIWNFDIAYFYKLLHDILTWVIALPTIYAYLLSSSVVMLFCIASLFLSIRFYNRRDL